MIAGTPDPEDQQQYKSLPLSGNTPFFRGPKLPSFLRMPKSGFPRGTSPGLPTQQSTLMKVLDFLNRGNAAKNELLTGGNPVKGLTGESKLTGADVLSKFGAFNENPTMTSEKIGKGVGGFLFDALTDPLNLVTGGPIGKGAEELLQTGKLAPGVFNQMRRGERALASIGIGKHVLETPEWLNKAVGHAGGKVGEVLNSLPGSKLVKDTFTPSFQKLRTTMGTVRQGAEDTLSKLFGNKTIPEYNKIYKDGVQQIMKNPMKVMPKDVLDHYISKGLNPASRRDAGIIMGHEIYRHGDAGILNNQHELIHDLKQQIIDPAFDKKTKQIAMEKLKAIKETPTILSNAKSGVHFQQAEKAAQLVKQLDEKIPSIVKGAGLPFKTMEEGHVSRTASQSSMKQLIGKSSANKAGTLWTHVDNKSRTLGRGLTHGQAEALSKSPIARANILAGTFGSETPKHEKGLMEALSTKVGESSKHEPFYESNPMVALQRRAENAAKSASSATEMKKVINDPMFASKVKRADTPYLVKIPTEFQKAVGTNQVYMSEEVGREFNKWAETISNPKLLNEWLGVYDNFLHAFKKYTLFGTPMIGLQTASKYIMGHSFIAYMNNAFSGFGAGYAANIAKIVPMRAKLMEEGEQGAAKWAKLIDSAPKIPLSVMKIRPGDQVKYAKYLTPDGFNLLKLADDTGRFGEGAMRDIARNPAEVQMPQIRSALEKYSGTGISQDMGKMADAFSRMQYAATRIKQGYDPIVALDEARSTLYDYAGGLSDVEQQVGRRIIPFYSWIRFNTPAMLMATLRNPGKATNAIKAIRNIEATTGKPQDGKQPDERILDDFLNGQMHVRVYQGADGKWRYFGLQHYLPLADLESFTSPSSAFHELTGALSPAIKTPIELATNKSLVFKKPGGEPQDIERYPGELTSMLGIPIRKNIANAIQETVRPIAELNRMNPGGVFGQQGKPNALGAVRDFSDQSPLEKVLKLGSVRFTPEDQHRAIVNSQAAYRDKAAIYKNAMRRAQAMNKSGEVQQIQGLLDKLNQQAIPLPSQQRQHGLSFLHHKRGF